MKKKLFWALVLAVLIVSVFAPAGILGAMALPFTALGGALRALSLSGAAGNAAAIALFAAVSLAPLAVWLRGRRQREDWLLLLLIPVTAFVLYGMVNPGLRPPMLQNEVGDITCAGMVWSVLITWGVLKLLRSGERILERSLYQALALFLQVWAAQYLISGVGGGARDWWTEILYIRERANSAFVSPLPNYLFISLDLAVRAAEGTLMALVLWKGSRLLAELERDPYSAGTVAASAEVAVWCRRVLTIVSLGALALNLGQVMMSAWLVNVRTTVHIPVASLAAAFGMLALTRLLVQGKELKDESDLFI